MMQMFGMKKMKLVLIGNGMVGMRAIEKIMEASPYGFEITIFGAEEMPNYNRMRLAEILAGHSKAPDLILNETEWYEKAGITLHLGKEITAIDRDNKKVTAADGTEAAYDYLIIATGSHAFLPPIDGIDKQGVIPFRNLADCRAIMSAAATGTQAVVIGGGLLGLEAADGLAQLGVETTLVHDMPHLLNMQLDRTAGTMLERAISSRGIKVHTGVRAQAILGNGSITGVMLDDNETIACDFVVVATGIVPNTTLAKAAGLACGRGISVNEYMQTSDPAIYAVGECTEYLEQSWGFVAPLYEQAAALASHISGSMPQPFMETVFPTRLKVSGIELFSAGQVEATEGCEPIIYLDGAEGIYKKLLVKNDRLVGVVMYGDTHGGPEAMEMMKAGTDILAIRPTLFPALATSAAPAEHDPMVCGCNGVTRSMVVEAIKAGGLTEPMQVMAATRAGRGCGACFGAINQLLFEAHAEMDEATAE